MKNCRAAENGGNLYLRQNNRISVFYYVATPGPVRHKTPGRHTGERVATWAAIPGDASGIRIRSGQGQIHGN